MTFGPFSSWMVKWSKRLPASAATVNQPWAFSPQFLLSTQFSETPLLPSAFSYIEASTILVPWLLAVCPQLLILGVCDDTLSSSFFCVNNNHVFFWLCYLAALSVLGGGDLGRFKNYASTISS